MASPLSLGLITRAAVQGEVLWGLTGKFNMISDAEQVGVQVAQQVGCQTAADVLACLRATPAAALVEAAPTDLVPWVGGVVLPKSPLQSLSSGPRIPLLVGFDREEDGPFGYLPLTGKYTTNIWIRDTNALGGSPLGAQIRSLYPPNAYDALIWSTVTAATDTKRGCPTRRLANTVSQGAPVWRYLYTHTYETIRFSLNSGRATSSKSRSSGGRTLAWIMCRRRQNSCCPSG